MMRNLWYFFLFSLLTVVLLEEDVEEYDAPRNHNDSDYGKTWIYFPDGDGNPQRVNLTRSPPSTSRNSNSETQVSFLLYTQRNKDKYSELDLIDDDFNETEAGPPFNDDYFDPMKDVKILTHGWRSSGSSPSVMMIKDAYLENRDLNVIVVDWEPLASNIFYFIPVTNTKIVGKRVGKLINYLIANRHMSYDQFHVIGHSLGAHVSGFTGKAVENGKIARITGLDPAKPGFENTAGPEDRLDSTDAKFVDVIHSCSGVLGYSSPLGSIDFYPNGGSPPQPGCEGIYQILEACSHSRAYIYYAESIRNSQGFPAKRCPDSYQVRATNCEQHSSDNEKEGSQIKMGDSASPDADGVYYVHTNNDEPYGANFDNRNK